MARKRTRTQGAVRRLAASLVITVAVTPGCRREGACEPPDCHINPPPPQPTALPPPPTATGTGAPNGSVLVPEPTASTEPTATTLPTGPSATATGTVVRLPPGTYYSDGKCWTTPPANCPPFDPQNPRTCNPPPPQRVPCPTGYKPSSDPFDL